MVELPLKRLAVVIVNYKRPRLVADCLKSIQEQLDPALDVAVVVDNGSGPDSRARLAQAVSENGWDSWVRLVFSNHNGGFSAGNNLGIQAVDAEAYLLLNSDTIVRPGAIASLLSAMETHPDAGIISPCLEWPDATPQISVFRYPSPLSEFVRSASTRPVSTILKDYEVPVGVAKTPVEFEWTCFAAVVIRRAVFYDIGFLDTDYFMYFEDVDYCRRAREAGWRTLHWPDAHVVHLAGGTSPVTALAAANKRRPEYYYAARSRYFGKNYGRTGLFFANMLWMLGRGISRTIEFLNKRRSHICDKEWRDIWTNFRDPLKRREGAEPASLPRAEVVSASSELVATRAEMSLSDSIE